MIPSFLISKFSATSIITLFESFFALLVTKFRERHQINSSEEQITRRHATPIIVIDSKETENDLSFWREVSTRVWLRPYFFGIWNSQSSAVTTSRVRSVICLSVSLLSYALQTSSPCASTSVWAVYRGEH